jgi:AcrR family transcriptional regulator
MPRRCFLAEVAFHHFALALLKRNVDVLIFHISVTYMNVVPPPSSRRPYRLGARAQAAEATGDRIVAAFIARAETQWFDEITLDAIAGDAGVTLQTVIRRFGGKQGLLEAAIDRMGSEIRQRRTVPVGDIEAAIAVLAEDYQASGDLMWRLVIQEDRSTLLRAATDTGRASHRAWITATFAPHLAALSPAAVQVRVDGLVAATDLFLWVLICRDMGRPLEAFQTLAKTLIRAVLSEAPANSGATE